MNSKRKRKLKTLAIGGLAVLTLTSCSTSGAPKYDEVELLEYQACLSQVTTKVPSGGIPSVYTSEIEGILKWCEYLKPLPAN
jgi:hypothetical protein